ncbi:MarR family winged helix-turn-helix transcriptional regulator [Citricoccus sp. CH26A]|uniref:MarR family winged helix-turn-helix transcriptional regulator n=1 Tax=Citricoccus TaxID=169133 RepID=UPI0002E64122|nr:MarR family transcriptional regulator [Citricoccus sp. CH26A]
MVDLPGDERARGYWFEEPDSSVRILRALRRFRVADRDMRRRMSEGMDMNATDVDALRFVIARQGAGETVTPRALATHLGISTASTTKLLDRLGRSGHLRREPHPRDRRSVVVVATDHAHAEVRARLSRMHRRMMEVAQAVPEASRPDVARFLEEMAECLSAEDTLEDAGPLTAAPPPPDGSDEPIG